MSVLVCTKYFDSIANSSNSMYKKCLMLNIVTVIIIIIIIIIIKKRNILVGVVYKLI